MTLGSQGWPDITLTFRDGIIQRTSRSLGMYIQVPEDDMIVMMTSQGWREASTMNKHCAVASSGCSCLCTCTTSIKGHAL